MDDATKAQAREKLHKIANQIGYPNKWRDYSALEPDRTSWASNDIKASRFLKKYDLDKIGKPLDREDWTWPPSIVNAQYDPQLNRMQFPAGILQPPFFDRDYSPSQNYGGIGFVMGHELTHGFDDEGRQYDALGNLREWWTEASGKAYEERAQCVKKQYDDYAVLDGQHVNGALTLGENIADIGGLKMSLHALRRQEAGRPDGKIAGFDREQRFFLSAAQVWCLNERPEYTRLRLTVDPHSPARYRVNGPMQDSPDFEKAFQCKPGSKMAPANRCEVW
jgi:endothelin-converting enzyme/putative endopeptidase